MPFKSISNVLLTLTLHLIGGGEVDQGGTRTCEHVVHYGAARADHGLIDVAVAIPVDFESEAGSLIDARGVARQQRECRTTDRSGPSSVR